MLCGDPKILGADRTDWDTFAPRRTWRSAVVALAVLLTGACANDDGAGAPGDGPTIPPPVETTTTPPPTPTLPPEVNDPAQRPDAGVFLPPLGDHRTDDSDGAELQQSLTHEFADVEVRERVLLGDGGFVVGRVVVVTVPPGTDADDVLVHRFGTVPREPATVAGTAMEVLDAPPHPVLAWAGHGFVVTFERGQDMTHEWVESLAAATVDAMRQP